MQDENYWVEKANSAEAKLKTLQDQYGPAIDRIKQFKANFGVKERSDGSIDVDFDKFVKALGIESALELRGIIDETYSISGGAGEKPKVRLHA